MRNLRHSAVHRRRALGTVLALALITTSGCATVTGQAETEEATSNTTKEDSTTTEEAGTELSDWFEATSENFDYQAPGFDYFNTCEVISPADMEKLGLRDREIVPHIFNFGIDSCTYHTDPPESGTYLTMTDPNTLETLEGKALVHPQGKFIADEKVHTFESRDFFSTHCGVGSFTPEGRVSVISTTHFFKHTQDDACTSAYNVLKLISQNTKE
ncbi:DUF3558 family protein [Corynebacterium sp. TAE3-ERU30]|uniref:DUF3558 family protein n=1 Tax=Corynebacterium sp. TAE3-ERU30 TaxID=2849496 RepID=UPI001C48A19C|nr:DUF3558 family protein [Corynebacterium sp. TAE3-ERU30]MBV7280856.1 DUF3558 family protein [Corynebacterium sp. TAE3-ERU30]